MAAYNPAKRRQYYLKAKEAGAKRGESPYVATHGHGGGGTAPAFLAGQDQVVTVRVTYEQSKRVGRYDSLVNRLTKGQISEKEFDRRVSRWAPLRVLGGELPAGRYQFADADTALYLAETTRALPDREYTDRMYFDIQGS